MISPSTARPELQIAAVAEVQWETEEHSDPEYYTFCSYDEDDEPYFHGGVEVNDGVWSLAAYQPQQKKEQYMAARYLEEDEEAWEELYRQIYPELGLHSVVEDNEDEWKIRFLDSAGNRYFLQWDLNPCTTPAGWGFPENWDWIPFDRNREFEITPDFYDDWFEDEDY